MNFSVNSTFLYILAACVIIFVLAQSIFFLVRAWKRGKELGIKVTVLKKTVLSTIVFTIAPAVSILIGVITLAKFLGIPLPWIRMSVIGALTYELPAATSTANALGVSLSETIADPSTYSAIAWVMTIGILPSIILPALFGGLAVVYVSKNWKISIVPLIFMVTIFLCFPGLGSSVGIMVPVGVVITLISARIMYKKGVL